jgi:predicted transposase YdaD
LIVFHEETAMPRRRSASDDFDSPWKDALHVYFRSFLGFFFPDIHADIDWEQGYEALDKEFQQIVRQAKQGKGLADKLFKVWLSDGTECWLLIHVEIQGEYEANFPERMFNYNVAARRLYNQTVVSLAILCDDRPNWRPSVFSYGRWNSQMQLAFRIAKLLDYAGNLSALEESDNPFACIVLSHLQALATQKAPQSRREWKLRIVKRLYSGKWSKEDVRNLFRLIDWIMTLPEDIENDFRSDVMNLEEEKKMPYVTSIERLALARGLEQGREKGREEGKEEGKEAGREEGKEEGLRDGLLEGIGLALEVKFGRAARKILAQARKVEDSGQLRQFARLVMEATTLDELRHFFSK